MAHALSCTVDAMQVRGQWIAMVPFGDEPASSGRRSGARGTRSRRCGDCGVVRGGWHHPGCDAQRCPRCRGQLLSCGCWPDEHDNDDDADRNRGWLSGARALGADGNGAPTEMVRVAGVEVIVHHDHVPESDITIVRGIRCTTALRTVIDLAAEVAAGKLDDLLDDCLGRELFTVEQAWSRLAEPDMVERRGAQLLCEALRRRSAM